MTLYLASRNLQHSQKLANDIRSKHKSMTIECLYFDVLSNNSQEILISKLFSGDYKQHPIGLITFTGYLGNQVFAQSNHIERALWFLIMRVIKHIPEFIFKKTDFPNPHLETRIRVLDLVFSSAF